MIRDAKGRKWYLRFKQYRNGWHWDARCQAYGQEANRTFKTKELAEADARRVISSRDVFAEMREFFRRLSLRGSECRLTAADHKAIKRAGAAR
jgi:hypothetical protein